MQHGELRTNGCPWFIGQLFKLSYTFISNIRIAGSSTLHPASTRSESTSSTVRGDPSHEPAENKITNRNGDNETVRGNPLHDVPEWLKEFTENIVDEWVSEHRDAPASLLVNQLQIREEKWYRASTVFILTSRETTIATSATRPRQRGLLAENALAQPYLEQKIVVSW